MAARTTIGFALALLLPLLGGCDRLPEEARSAGAAAAARAAAAAERVHSAGSALRVFLISPTVRCVSSAETKLLMDGLAAASGAAEGMRTLVDGDLARLLDGGADGAGAIAAAAERVGALDAEVDAALRRVVARTTLLANVHADPDAMLERARAARRTTNEQARRPRGAINLAEQRDPNRHDEMEALYAPLRQADLDVRAALADAEAQDAARRGGAVWDCGALEAATAQAEAVARDAEAYADELLVRLR